MNLHAVSPIPTAVLLLHLLLRLKLGEITIPNQLQAWFQIAVHKQPMAYVQTKQQAVHLDWRKVSLPAQAMSWIVLPCH